MAADVIISAVFVTLRATPAGRSNKEESSRNTDKKPIKHRRIKSHIQKRLIVSEEVTIEEGTVIFNMLLCVLTSQ